ncbi:hydantoinase/carbamoylase family amidase [Orrella sp. 11846]|uniref:hydantoinase/carbamoylase family amidase n=1 Tax=Orrella sp. 11846 TaxID=3409913 RepID=UPI003B5BC2FF
MDKLAHLASTLLNEVRDATADTQGVSRESYGPGEQIAIDILQRNAKELGLTCSFDAYQNLWIDLPNFQATTDTPEAAIVIGSHVDSVPQGGNYDGLAGIVAGVLVLVHLHQNNLTPPHPVRVLAMRGEESAWYGKSYIGSLALFGKFNPRDLDLPHRNGTQTLREAMQKCGIDTDRIERGEAILSPEQVRAYLELHIEQGPVMIDRQWPVAVVTGIRGNIRHNRVHCIGETGHSGAVPRWLRKDSVLATAELLSRLDEHWRVLLQMGMDLVMTVGILSTRPESHAVSVIPGEVSFSFEVRSQDTQTLHQFYDLMQDECKRIEKARGVRFEFDRKVETPPALVDEHWVQRLSQAGQTVLGTPVEKIPSGAGHDAAVFSYEGIPAAMVFIRNAHGSHNPHEAMEIDDFMLGVQVLIEAVLQAD